MSEDRIKSAWEIALEKADRLGKLSPEEAKKIVQAWLTAPFSREVRHTRRLAKVAEIERKNFQ